MSEQIKRYNIMPDYSVQESEIGWLVQFADHAASLSARDAEIERLRGACKQAQAEIKAMRQHVGPEWTCPECGSCAWNFDPNEECVTRSCDDCACHVNPDEPGYPLTWKEVATAAEAQVRGLREALSIYEKACDAIAVGSSTPEYVARVALRDARAALAPAQTAAHGEACKHNFQDWGDGSSILMRCTTCGELEPDWTKPAVPPEEVEARASADHERREREIDAAARRVAEAAERVDQANHAYWHNLTPETLRLRDAAIAESREARAAFRAAKNGGGE